MKNETTRDLPIFPQRFHGTYTVRAGTIPGLGETVSYRVHLTQLGKGRFRLEYQVGGEAPVFHQELDYNPITGALDSLPDSDKEARSISFWERGEAGPSCIYGIREQAAGGGLPWEKDEDPYAMWGAEEGGG